MDPSVVLAKSMYSFGKQEKPSFPQPLPKSNVIPTENLRNSTNIYYSADPKIASIYQEVQALKQTVSKIRPELYEYASIKTNENYVGKSIFESVSNSTMSKEGNNFIKLANLDTIFDLTQVMRRVNAAQQYLDEPKDRDLFRFCAINDGPGGFTKYVQFRRPGSYGYGMSKYHNPDPEKLNWNPAEFDPNRFDILKTSDGSGNFDVHYSDVINYQSTAKPLDLFLANGGTSEFESIRTLILEIYCASILLKENGTLLLRCFELFTNLSIDLIQLLQQGFAEVYLFKPCSSPPGSSESYIIAKGRNSVKIYDTLKLFLAGSYNRLFQIVPPEIIVEMNKHNSYILELQKTSLTKIIRFCESFENGNPELIIRNNTDRYLILWSIPSNSKLDFSDVPPKSIGNKPNAVKLSEGKTIFGIYHYLFQNWIEKVKDKTQRVKNLYMIRAYLLDVIFGIENKYPVEYPLELWSHSENESTYTFTLGKYKRSYPKEKIDILLKQTGSNWNLIYDLVERYYPFKPESLEKSFYELNQTEAFSSPLTNTLSRYTSYYNEDKVFGSLGKFFDVYPSKDVVWNLYPPTSDYILNRLDKTLNKDTKIVMYLPKWERLPFIEKLIKEWNASEIVLKLQNHTTGEITVVNTPYLKITN